MRKLYKVFILTSLLLYGCSVLRTDYNVVADVHKELSKKEITEKLEPKRLHKDIDFLVKTIEKVHVAPYHSLDKEVFYMAVSDIKDSIDKPLTRKEFYQKITPIVHLLNDSHTTVWFPIEMQDYYEKKRGLYFPLEVTTDLKSRIFVKENYTNYKIQPNEEILSINDISSKDLIDKLANFEYGAVKNSNIRRMEKRFHYHLWQDLDITSPFKVQLSDTTITIQGMPLDELSKKKLKYSIIKPKAIQYKLLAKDIGYLSVPTFNMGQKEFKRKIGEVFSAISRDQPSNLIIDVRNNQGGSEQNGFELLDYIAKEPYHMYSMFLRKKSRQYDRRFKSRFKWWIRWLINIRVASKIDEHMKTYFTSYATKYYGEIDTLDNSVLRLERPREDSLNYSGKIYVLQNEFSYSATVGFLGVIKDYKIGTIVGTESGESPNGFGEGYLFELPKSRLMCVASTTFVIRASGNTDMTHGVIPDIKVTQMRSNGKDNILDTTLKLIVKEAE